MKPIRLGHFELEAPIAKGGMGEVWRGTHVEQQLPVAVKVLTSAQTRQPNYLAAFRNEIHAIAGLNHPGIVVVFDHGELTHAAEELSEGRLIAGSPYLVMEHLSGGSLQKLRGPGTWTDLKSLLQEILDALAHAHARGVIHRDLKLGNVLLGTPGDARPGYKIIDFGLASTGLREGGLPQELSAGTPAFEAPEQILGRWRDQGPWTDLYALGCMAYALASGRPPFGGDEDDQVLRCHLMVPMPPLVNRIPVPDGFEGWVKRLMAKHPSDRFSCSADAAYALRCLSRGATASGAWPAWRPSTPSAEPAPESNVDTDELITRPEGPTPILASSFSDDPLPRLESAMDGMTEEAHPVLLPPCPRSWLTHGTREEQPSGRLLGAGLSLYGLRTIPLVDREPERDALWRAVRDVRRQGRAKVVLISGDAGTGKTRLVQWLVERAYEVCGMRTLKGIHSAIRGPADGLSRMVAQFLGCVGLDRAGILKRTETLLREQGVEDEYEWQALTELMKPATRAELEAGARRIRFRNPRARYVLIRRLLERVSGERSVLVWLDDVQWGRDALFLTRYLLDVQNRYPNPVLLLLTVQTEALAERPGASRQVSLLRGLDDVTNLSLGPLGANDHLKLIRELLGLHPDLAGEIAERTGGNPLFVVQLVGDWVQRGALTMAEGGLVLRPGEDAPLPDDLHEVWRGRIERLLEREPESTQQCLEMAAALGRDVDYNEWNAVGDAANLAINRRLVGTLVHSRLARNTESGFSFVHGMLRESLERMARDAGRWTAHNRACADMLSSLYAGQRRRVSERLGRHLLEAGDAESAVEPLLEGARQRYDTSEFIAAHHLVGLCERALETLGTEESDERWGECWVTRARIFHLQGQFDRGEEHSARAEARAKELGWSNILPAALKARAYGAQQRGDLLLSERLYLEARELFEQQGVTEGMAGCLHGLGEVARLRADIEQASEYNRRALALFEHLDDPIGVADCLRGLGVVTQHRGDLSGAADLYRQAMARYESVDSPYGVAVCVNDLAEVARWQGKLEHAEAGYRRALAIYESIGSRDDVITDVNLGLVLLTRSRYSDAKKVFIDGAKACEEVGRLGFLGAVHTALLCCAAHEADWADFDKHLEAATSLLDSTALIDADIAWPAQLAGDLALRAKELDRARDAYQLSRQQYGALNDSDRVDALDTLLASLAK